LVFQLAEDYVPQVWPPAPGGQRSMMHLDLQVRDLDAAVADAGSCQRTWEHAVPKTHRPVGPRISIQFRPAGVR